MSFVAGSILVAWIKKHLHVDEIYSNERTGVIYALKFYKNYTEIYTGKIKGRKCYLYSSTSKEPVHFIRENLGFELREIT